MPHLVLLYDAALEARADIGRLCRTLADTLVAARDGAGRPVFPPGGVRVFAYPAAHCAVADGVTAPQAGFVYLNLRIAAGRDAATISEVGSLLKARTSEHFASLLAVSTLGITLQIDESRQQVYDARLGNLHARFSAPAPAGAGAGEDAR
jgi:5-carboxymethyl-2-hydroxymuconate isomerase